MDRSGRRVEEHPPAAHLPEKETMADHKILHFMGIDGDTGDEIYAPDLERISQIVGERLLAKRQSKRDFLANPMDLADSGWGVVFAQADEAAGEMYEALQPLLKRREKQAGVRYREFRGDDGYLPGGSALGFLKRFGTIPGPSNPVKIPCYILLVGSPEQIPYEFQYELDHQRAVGRLYFDRIEDYAQYARAVVEAEEEAMRSSRKVTFFGPRHDAGTEISNDGLLRPLIDSMLARSDCKVQCLLGEGATKAGLKNLLTDGEVPDLLFTAGHGVLYRSGHPRQFSHQGALVCQDWPGKIAPTPDHVFAGLDLDAGASLKGLLAFLFACNSAGAPHLNDFFSDVADPRTVAPHPFVSSLAQRLLGQGALAVIGHVEQVWQCSFLWEEAGYQTEVFVETLKRLLEGAPVGWALEPINQRHTDLEACLSRLLQDHYRGLPVHEREIAELWMASRDARNYVIVGDPAVRLFTPPMPPNPQTRKRVFRDGSSVLG
jgi:hypothetical protein